MLMYVIHSGAATASTWIYGWYFSVPALIALAALLMLCWATLAKVSRPPLSSDPTHDTALRRSRSGIVTGATLGALFLHLAYVAISLDGTASIRLTSTGGHGGAWIESWSTFVALTPALRITGMMLLAIGIALWATMFFRAVLGRRKSHRP